jgi:hypothetical protein
MAHLRPALPCRYCPQYHEIGGASGVAWKSEVAGSHHYVGLKSRQNLKGNSVTKEFYRYQRKRTQILLIWGVANTVTGLAAGIRAKNKFWRQFWFQAFGWGAIDALIALAGIRSQAKKLGAEDKASAQSSDEKPLSSAVVKDIRNFYLILLVNVFLDMGYILSGEFIRRWGVRTERPDRQGIGRGFQFQGLYLFLYDLMLAMEVKQRWISKL